MQPHPLLLLSLAALALAGCVGQSVQPAALPLPGWHADCSVANWADPCSAKATQTHGPANELMLAVNPTDPGNVVIGAKDYTAEGSDCVWAGTSVTKDGGRTWANGWVGGGKQDRDPHVQAYRCVTDPVLDFGADGTVYYLVEAYGSAAADSLPELPGVPGVGSLDPGSNMWLAASKDGGSTWEFRGAISLGTGSPGLLHDKSDLAASPRTGTLAAAWDAFNDASSQLVWVRSTDGGATFSPPRPLIGLARAQHTGAMVDLDFDQAGLLHAAFLDWTTGDVLYARSSDDGLTFSEPVQVAAAHPWRGQNASGAQWRIFDSTQLAVDGSGGPRSGTVYLTWADDSAAEGDHDVWLAASKDRGVAWGEPQRVAAWAGDQLHSNIVVADDGTLHMLLYDRHYDPAHRLLDATHGLSADGGRSWAWDRLSAGSFDGDLGVHQSGAKFMGDYIAIGAGEGAVYMAWADTREGRADVAVAKWVPDAAPAGAPR